MSLNYEMARYTELTGQDGTKVSISRLGGYLDGYEKGREDAFKEFVDLYREFLKAPPDEVCLIEDECEGMCIDCFEKWLQQRGRNDE